MYLSSIILRSGQHTSISARSMRHVNGSFWAPFVETVSKQTFFGPRAKGTPQTNKNKPCTCTPTSAFAHMMHVCGRLLSNLSWMQCGAGSMNSCVDSCHQHFEICHKQKFRAARALPTAPVLHGVAVQMRCCGFSHCVLSGLLHTPLLNRSPEPTN